MSYVIEGVAIFQFTSFSMVNHELVTDNSQECHWSFTSLTLIIHEIITIIHEYVNDYSRDLLVLIHENVTGLSRVWH